MLDIRLPVALTDEHGVLWVDNADGTVTDTSDVDGRPDRHWDDVPTDTYMELHTAHCRRLQLAAECLAGEGCADTERESYENRGALQVFALLEWGVVLR